MLLMSSSGKLGCLSFTGGIKVAEELTPLLGEVQLPPLSGDMLYEVVQKKSLLRVAWMDGSGGIQSFACCLV